MARMAVYYTQYNDDLVPFYLVVNFNAELDWEKKTIYMPIKAKYKRHHAEDFNPNTLSISVTQDDMVVSPDRPGYLGIHLPHLIKRIEKMKKDEELHADFNHWDINQFIMLLEDVSVVTQMNGLREHFIWQYD